MITSKTQPVLYLATNSLDGDHEYNGIFCMEYIYMSGVEMSHPHPQIPNESFCLYTELLKFVEYIWTP